MSAAAPRRIGARAGCGLPALILIELRVQLGILPRAVEQYRLGARRHEQQVVQPVEVQVGRARAANPRVHLVKGWVGVGIGSGLGFGLGSGSGLGFGLGQGQGWGLD